MSDAFNDPTLFTNPGGGYAVFWLPTYDLTPNPFLETLSEYKARAAAAYDVAVQTLDRARHPIGHFSTLREAKDFAAEYAADTAQGYAAIKNLTTDTWEAA